MPERRIGLPARLALVLAAVTSLLMAGAASAELADPLIALPAKAQIAPAMDCGNMMRVSAAEAGGIAYRLASATVEPATGDRPAFCLVKGYATPQTEFELRLPFSGYTGRYLQGGCGGMCGIISNDFSPHCSSKQAYGGTFAVAFENGGHHGTGIGDGTWALGDPELRLQFAYKSPHAVAVVSKALIARFYGRAPERSYFSGCSGGGRVALMEAQRFPEDFDGIVAGSSVAMPAAMQMFLWEAQKGLDAQDREIFTPAAVALLHAAVLKACDGLDGIADGQIDDPRHCAFDPARLACPRGAGTDAACLTQPQVAAARAYYQGPRDASGKALFPGGAPYGGELGWVGRGAPTQTGKFAAEAFLKYLLLPGELPADFSWRDWQFTQASVARLLAAGLPYDVGNPDMTAFRELGGKLILWQGAADNAAGPYGMLDYYQAVREQMGGLAATRALAQMYLVPGGYHCQGGYVAYEADFLGAIVAWVEAGRTPESIMARAELPEGGVRRRPLYAYPTGTRYLGGDMNDAASFAPVPVTTEPQDGFGWPGSRARTKTRRNLAPSD